MRAKGYRRKYSPQFKKNVYYDPTQLQLTVAWMELKKKYIKFRYRIEGYKDGKITVFRATHDININGKKYRKGMFIPYQK